MIRILPPRWWEWVINPRKAWLWLTCHRAVEALIDAEMRKVATLEPTPSEEWMRGPFIIWHSRLDLSKWPKEDGFRIKRKEADHGA
jgi:hypothetical protein